MTRCHWSSLLLQRWPIKMKDLHWLTTSSSNRITTGICSSAKSDLQDQRKSTNRTYQEAIGKLNDLQSNASVLQSVRKTQGKFSHRNIPEATQFAQRAGLTMDQLNTLPIIHVSGTKGKGSVCAFCESILRKHGLKTGFYSSPHLVEVRERIRVNGLPMEKEDFASSFFEVYDRLDDTKKDHEEAMPAYFRFLTIMAFHVFLKEKVDVALIEVGIGGEHDCTNIIRQPTVVGITSLGMDHTFLLGETLGQIAWHKAGICKPGKPVFTVPQPEEAMKVVQDRAKEIGAPLRCAVSLEKNHFGEHSIQLGLAGEHQRVNASLAIHLCASFLENIKAECFQVVPDIKPQTAKRVKLDETSADERVADDLGILLAQPIVLPESFITGLRECYWAGRNQSFTHGRVTYYIDGAHTIRSIEACRRWFLDETFKERQNLGDNVAKILVFNSTGKRDSIALLKPLMECKFDGVVFCPNVVSEHDGKNSPAAVPSLFSDIPAQTVAVPSITDALQWAACAKDPHLSSPSREYSTPAEAAIAADHIQVLVTGSIHLVGGVIKVLNPDLVLHQ
ncbi:folylpolyglutamate synthase, mitochondrial-like isoform X2 [Apostichopus japonicus]|uniref:folylpolyglutamate synthase, mitochondrial-like isoform X2 n=1 Tax=Stichopus japonicus TaxID=307972 RepID=UPI003AB64D1C